MNCWNILLIEATEDKREIKRAYARRLKVTHPEDDAVAYQQLREAYDAALEDADYRAKYGDYDEWEEDEEGEEDDVFTISERLEQENKELPIAVVQDGKPVATSAGLNIVENELEVLQQFNTNRTLEVKPSELNSDSITNDLTINDEAFEKSQAENISIEYSLDQLENDENRVDGEEQHLDATTSASKAVSAILIACDKDEGEAIKVFLDRVNSLEFAGLDEAYELEGDLLVGLYNQELMPQKFAESVHEHYHWSVYDNQFKYDDDYSAYFEYVVCLIESRTTFNHLLKNSMPAYRSEECERVRRALYSAFDEKILKEVSGDAYTKKLAVRIISLLVKHEAQYEDIEKYVGPIGDEITEWWEENVGAIKKSKPGIKESKEKGSNFRTWIAIFFVLILVKACVRAADDFSVKAGNSNPQELVRALDALTEIAKRYNKSNGLNQYELGRALKGLQKESKETSNTMLKKEEPHALRP